MLLSAWTERALKRACTIGVHLSCRYVQGLCIFLISYLSLLLSVVTSV